MIRFYRLLLDGYGIDFSSPKINQLRAYNKLQTDVARAAYVAAKNSINYKDSFEHFFCGIFANSHPDYSSYISFSEAFSDVFTDLLKGRKSIYFQDNISDFQNQLDDCKFFLGEKIGHSPSKSELLEEIVSHNIVGQVLFDRLRDSIKKKNPLEEEANYELPRWVV